MSESWSSTSVSIDDTSEVWLSNLSTTGFDLEDFDLTTLGPTPLFQEESSWEYTGDSPTTYQDNNRKARFVSNKWPELSTPVVCGKRTADMAFPTNSKDSRSRKKPCLEAAGLETNKQRQLACPFQKHDPVKYGDCSKFRLHRIKDVKQHLRRRHMQPHMHEKIYCPRCYHTFESFLQRDEHTRGTECALQEVQQYGGISLEQSNRLNKNSDRNLSVEDQWNDMWDIIFPDQPAPHSPFSGDYLNEVVPVLRKVWNEQCLPIIIARLQNRNTEETVNGVDNIVKKVFDLLEGATGDTILGGSGDQHRWIKKHVCT